MSELYDRYVRALIKDIKNNRAGTNNKELDTLFLGGGTPTVLGGKVLARVIRTCRETYGFAEDAEISIEANPGTINRDTLNILCDSGINRLSIGVQSFNDKELLALGRAHNSNHCVQSVRDAREMGFDNISLDLMYGLPGQTVDSWLKNLKQALALNPDHLSLYQLTIEEGTEFYRLYKNDALDLPDEGTILEMDTATIEYLNSRGLDQYEISNFSRAGYECRHNIVYWMNEEFIGCGAGAAGYLNGRRYKVISDPLDYCSAVESGFEMIEDSEVLSTEASFRETVIMGLRLVKGVDKGCLYRRYNHTLSGEYGSILIGLRDCGLIEEDDHYLRLTARGRQLANQVMAELV